MEEHYFVLKENGIQVVLTEECARKLVVDFETVYRTLSGTNKPRNAFERYYETFILPMKEALENC